MKIRRFDLDDDERPATVTVEMTMDEAALIYAFVGHISPKRVTDACGDARWSNALLDVASALGGGVFNRWFDDGWNDFGPRALRVDTLQGEVSRGDG